MRILLGYSWYLYPIDVRCWVENWCTRLRAKGFHVDPFYLTYNPPAPCLTWPELDAKWRTRDAVLLQKYDLLQTKLHTGRYDVFLNWNGINIHPEFVRQLPTCNVFACFDDPENSHNLSQPAAAAYDLAFCGNLAELDTYRAWGVQHVYHWPHGFHEDDYDPYLTKASILEGPRPFDLLLACDYTAPWRKAKLDAFAAAFPQGLYFGKGWPRGFLPESRRVLYYGRTKIGPNIHHSTGPINYRTFDLPANGVLLVGDNKKYLNQLFTLGKEAVGFDTLEEALDLCRYYLAHDRARREIAAAGWQRAHCDYNEESSFRRVWQIIEAARTRQNHQDTKTPRT